MKAVQAADDIISAHALILTEHLHAWSQRGDIVVNRIAPDVVYINHNDIGTNHLTGYIRAGDAKGHVIRLRHLARQLERDLRSENLPRHLQILVQLPAIGQRELIRRNLHQRWRHIQSIRYENMAIILVVSHIVNAYPIDVKDRLVARQLQLNCFLVVGAYGIEAGGEK